MVSSIVYKFTWHDILDFDILKPADSLKNCLDNIRAAETGIKTHLYTRLGEKFYSANKKCDR